MKPNDLTQLREITKQIKIATNHEVNVGIAKDVGRYPNGLSIVEVGTFHEFGTKRGVPRRSFLRMPFIEKQKIIDKAIAMSWKKITEGKGPTIKEFGILGIVGQNISKDAFATGGFGKWERLKPSTEKAKGSSEILLDTSKLVQSITNWVVKI
jgi:phage gpG-like protein